MLVGETGEVEIVTPYLRSCRGLDQKKKNKFHTNRKQFVTKPPLLEQTAL